MTPRVLVALFFGVVALGLAVYSMTLFQQQTPSVWLNGSPGGGLSSGGRALVVHGGAALLTAVGALVALGGKKGRLTSGLLFLLLALTLPVVGSLVVLAIVCLFSRPPLSDSRPEDRWVIGVPRMVMGEEASTPLALEPLAGVIRRLSLTDQGPLILGLKNQTQLGKLPLLRRFQNDDDAQLQFFAQGVLVGALEDLENSLRHYEERLATAKQAKDKAGIVDAALSAAEISLALAHSCPPADEAGAQVQARAALHVIDDGVSASQKTAQFYILACQALMILGDRVSARQSLLMAEKLEPQAISKSLRLRVWHDEECYPEVAEHLAKLSLSDRLLDPSLHEVRHFWGGESADGSTAVQRVSRSLGPQLSPAS